MLIDYEHVFDVIVYTWVHNPAEHLKLRDGGNDYNTLFFEL